MQKSQLIATILSEVEDPALRERLLRQVAEEAERRRRQAEKF